VSDSLVNVAAMADVVEINAALLHIKFIKHSIIADSQFEFGTILKSLVREIFQSYAHFIHLALNGLANRCRKRIKSFGERL
jgi:hypothetical protein